MTVRSRKHLIRGSVLSALLVLLALCTAVVAQRTNTDPSSVKRTAVPSIGPAPAASGSSNAAPPPVHKAAFSGSPYTVGSVVTPTTTGPEAEEHVAVSRLRRALAGLDSQQALELLLDKTRETSANAEFLYQIHRSSPSRSAAGRSSRSVGEFGAYA